ncbi:MAG TPA: hypothetical protein VNU45_17995 [Rummeliibacillus sp.]|nr:hypothetical protein [Rummeliibacillus sp.]
MNDEERKNHCYLGDAVYAEYDGECIILRNGDHRQSHCEDTIYLENFVIDALFRFVEDLKKRKTNALL